MDSTVRPILPHQSHGTANLIMLMIRKLEDVFKS